MTSRPVHLDLIRLDGDTQPRAEIDEAVVAEYAEAMEAGDEFPPIVVFHDGAVYWLADGFHRYHAMRRVGLTGTKLDMKSGTRRDAVLYSVGANQKHGLRRTNADKRKAVLTLLGDEEWCRWSFERIGAAAGISPRTVSAIAKEFTPQVAESPERTFTTRHGTVATMDTSNIGRRAETPRQEPAAEAPTPAPENGNVLPKPPRQRHFGTNDLTRVRESVDVIFHLSHEPLSRLPYAELKQQVAELRGFLTQFTD